MELNKDIRDRILSAADALYEQAGRTSFPTVDSVRKVAKVNMNDAAATMKEWRRAQTAQAAPVAITVPEAVHQLHSQALAALWQSAQNTANESLRAAQAGWEAERAEADTINKQLGDAYDAQGVELEAANRRIDELTAKYQARAAAKHRTRATHRGNAESHTGRREPGGHCRAACRRDRTPRRRLAGRT
jgi:colicin import membrane protein